jgi:quinol monooxygenase YgiN
MYAAVRRAKVKPGSADELARRVKKEALAIVSSISGFKAYYFVYGEDDTVVTVSVFEDRAAAEECNKQILGWIKENMGPFLTSPPEAIEGEVIVHKAE